MDLEVRPQTFKPAPGEIIIHKFNIEDFDYEIANNVHNYLVECFPNNPVLSMPDDYSLESMSKEELREMAENILREIGQN